MASSPLKNQTLPNSVMDTLALMATQDTSWTLEQSPEIGSLNNVETASPLKRRISDVLITSDEASRFSQSSDTSASMETETTSLSGEESAREPETTTQSMSKGLFTPPRDSTPSSQNMSTSPPSNETETTSMPENDVAPEAQATETRHSTQERVGTSPPSQEIETCYTPKKLDVLGFLSTLIRQKTTVDSDQTLDREDKEQQSSESDVLDELEESRQSLAEETPTNSNITTLVPDILSEDHAAASIILGMHEHDRIAGEESREQSLLGEKIQRQEDSSGMRVPRPPMVPSLTRYYAGLQSPRRTTSDQPLFRPMPELHDDAFTFPKGTTAAAQQALSKSQLSGKDYDFDSDDGNATESDSESKKSEQPKKSRQTDHVACDPESKLVEKFSHKMGGDGSGREKGDASQKPKKTKNQLIFHGPPAYLLDPNRIDPFADPSKVVLEADGTVCSLVAPIAPSLISPPYDKKMNAETYEFALPPTETISEYQVRNGIGSEIKFNQQRIEKMETLHPFQYQARNGMSSEFRFTRQNVDNAETMHQYQNDARDGICSENTSTTNHADKGKTMSQHHSREGSDVMDGIIDKCTQHPVFPATNKDSPNHYLDSKSKSEEEFPMHQGHTRAAIASMDEYDECALLPRSFQPSAATFSNIRNEDDASARGQIGKRKRSPTPPFDDWPVPFIDDMRLSPRMNRYYRFKSGKRTYQTTAEYEMERREFLELRDARRKKEDDEHYKGLLQFEGKQRGWDGKHEAERRATREKVFPDANTSPEIKPDPHRQKRLKVTEKSLSDGFDDLLTRYTVGGITLHDMVREEEERNYKEMMRRPWGFEEIKGEAIEDARQLRLEQERRDRLATHDPQDLESPSPDTPRKRHEQPKKKARSSSNEGERLRDSALGPAFDPPTCSRREVKKPRVMGDFEAGDEK